MAIGRKTEFNSEYSKETGDYHQRAEWGGSRGKLLRGHTEVREFLLNWSNRILIKCKAKRFTGGEWGIWSDIDGGDILTKLTRQDSC